VTSGLEGALDVEVPAALEGVRLDRAVSMLTGLSRAAATDLIEGGGVSLDGGVQTRRSITLGAGAHLVVAGVPPAPRTVAPEAEVSFSVVAVDDDVIVVDKPWDLVVHPGAGRSSGTLVAGVVARFPEVARLADDGLCEPDRPGIVHRLDRGTSGLLVVARSQRAVRSLSAQMTGHTAARRYAALVHGHLADDRGIVDAPVGRSARRPTQMTVSATGRDARTAYEVVARYEDPMATLVALTLDTGRTHQVRVHMAAIGHPVVGDDRYGERGRAGRAGLVTGRFFLHAFELAFDHPLDARRVSYRADLPEDLVAILPDRPELPSH
jgi:23S rRNA pseudouridine1911/1915/1917 synthase